MGEQQKPSSGDVLRALVEEALGAGVHPDRESVLRAYVGPEETGEDDRPAEGQGPGGEGKPQTERDRTSGEPRTDEEHSPTTTPETSSDSPKRKAGK